MAPNQKTNARGLPHARVACLAVARGNKVRLRPAGFGETTFAALRARRLVGLGRLELPTSRLSSARSNQLSYKPLHEELMPRVIGKRRCVAQRSPWRVFVREERETKTAKSRQWSSTILKLLAPECF